VKQLIGAYFIESTETESKQDESAPLKDTIQATKESIQATISELASKLDHLSSSNSDLQMEINNVSEVIENNNVTTQCSTRPPLPPPSINATINILDELADRERRRKNLLIYNFKEPSENQTDKLRFQELCSVVFKMDISLTKTVRLGKRTEDKPRPLLVCLSDESEKAEILSRSGMLRKQEQYSRVYVAPDRTKFERQKHRKLVDEMKHRRQNGEKNLAIRNGIIVTLPVRSNPTSTKDSSQHS